MPLRESFQWVKQNYVTFLKTYQKEILLLFAIFYPISFFFYLQMEGFRNPSPGMETQIILTAVSQAVAEYLIQIIKQIFIFIMMFALVFNKQLRHPLQTILKHFGQVFAEYLRCVLPILLWGLLFVIPGFIEYLRLLFVGPIVLFDKEYAKGNVNALAASRKLTYGHKKDLFLIYMGYLAVTVLTYGLFSLVVSYGPLNHFFVYSGLFFIEIFIYLFIGRYFFAIFPEAQTHFEE